MDNNFNQQAPQQPMYQQAPQQQMYQQPMYQPAPKKPSNINVMELWAFILSTVGAVMALVGSIMTCSCSASKSWDYKRLSKAKSNINIYQIDLVMLVAIFGALIAVTGVVLAILALKNKNAAVKAGKLSYIAIAVGAFGFIYGILPVLTICGYNCSLDAQATKKWKLK